jgi:hypothetical protein
MRDLRSIRRALAKAKPLVVQTVFVVLGRAVQSASRHDPEIRKDIADWPDGFTIMFKVLPRGPCVVLEKRGAALDFVGLREKEADLTVFVKNVASAFLVFTAQMGTPQAYCEHRALLAGDISQGIRFIRAMSAVQCYLFPEVVARRVVKQVPPLTLERLGLRIWIYTIGLALGR